MLERESFAVSAGGKLAYVREKNRPTRRLPGTHSHRTIEDYSWTARLDLCCTGFTAGATCIPFQVFALYSQIAAFVFKAQHNYARILSPTSWCLLTCCKVWLAL